MHPGINRFKYKITFVHYTCNQIASQHNDNVASVSLGYRTEDFSTVVANDLGQDIKFTVGYLATLALRALTTSLQVLRRAQTCTGTIRTTSCTEVLRI